MLQNEEENTNNWMKSFCTTRGEQRVFGGVRSCAQS